jgi:hypothetical protein
MAEGKTRRTFTIKDKMDALDASIAKHRTAIAGLQGKKDALVESVRAKRAEEDALLTSAGVALTPADPVSAE